MNEDITAVESERVDDIPLLLAVIQQMGLIEIFNEQLRRHGNWQGLGPGHLIAVWLVYILSTGDHRKSHLQEWAAQRTHTLSAGLGGVELDELDFTDDRLGLLLEQLSDDTLWQQSERTLNQRLLRVYELERSIARLDTTTASSYGRVDENGLLAFGYSKDHRPDLGQVKIATLTLDPLGMPLVTLPVPGDRADDGLYLPLLAEARHTLRATPAGDALAAPRGMLYVGDSKMGALATRADIAFHQEYYLMPLARSQLSAAQLRHYLTQRDPQVALEQLHVLDAQGQPQLLAEGFTLQAPLSLAPAPGADEHHWQERRFMVRSPVFAAQQAARLAQQLAAAEAALARLVQRRRGYAYPSSVAELAQRVAATLATHGCSDYFTVRVQQHTCQRARRAYGAHPARLVEEHTFELHIERQQAALQAVRQLFGWRAYATNAPLARLSLTQAVEVYRDAYLHEHGYSRLKGQPLSLTPLYLQKATQIIGLIRLLSLALRLLTVVEFVVRRELAAQDATLSGLYAGNPRRRTRRPRTETLLRAFRGITLTILHHDDQRWLHLTPLDATQQRILELLGFSTDLYTNLLIQPSEPLPISATSA
jgi:transposase